LIKSFPIRVSPASSGLETQLISFSDGNSKQDFGFLVFGQISRILLKIAAVVLPLLHMRKEKSLPSWQFQSQSLVLFSLFLSPSHLPCPSQFRLSSSSINLTPSIITTVSILTSADSHPSSQSSAILAKVHATLLHLNHYVAFGGVAWHLNELHARVSKFKHEF
jgi:hypothetical protein